MKSKFKNCPSEGGFDAYRKCKNHIVVKLHIPETAEREDATGHSFICDEAEVICFCNYAGEEIPEICGGYLIQGSEENAHFIRKGQLLTEEMRLRFFTRFQDALNGW